VADVAPAVQQEKRKKKTKVLSPEEQRIERVEALVSEWFDAILRVKEERVLRPDFLRSHPRFAAGWSLLEEHWTSDEVEQYARAPREVRKDGKMLSHRLGWQLLLGVEWNYPCFFIERLHFGTEENQSFRCMDGRQVEDAVAGRVLYADVHFKDLKGHEAIVVLELDLLYPKYFARCHELYLQNIELDKQESLVSVRKRMAHSSANNEEFERQATLYYGVHI
jgi:hypothetical protein